MNSMVELMQIKILALNGTCRMDFGLEDEEQERMA